MWLGFTQWVLCQGGARLDLEGFAYSHHRMQIVAIVTEEKLALGLRDVADIEVNLAQPVAEGDLVVPDPDIGHIVINVAQPHLV